MAGHNSDDGPRLEGQTSNEDQTSIPDPTPKFFWDEVGKGKASPPPREPDLTHYRDRNDRESA